MHRRQHRDATQQQLNAARELIALLQTGHLHGLPALHWSITPTGALITGTAPDASTDTVAAWAAALDTDAGDDGLVSTTVGALEPVQVLLAISPELLKP